MPKDVIFWASEVLNKLDLETIDKQKYIDEQIEILKSLSPNLKGFITLMERMKDIENHYIQYPKDREFIEDSISETLSSLYG